MKRCGHYEADFAVNPIWHKQFGVIWLDISAQKIITYYPTSEEEHVYDAMGPIAAIVPIEDGEFIGVYKDGLYKINFKMGTKKPFTFPTGLSTMHYLNDAKCGPDGYIWVGSSDGFFKKFRETAPTAMSDYPFHNSKLYRISPNGEIQILLENIASSNGLAWQTETNTFFHIDSAKQSIFEYKFLEEGILEFQRVVYTSEMLEGFPGGMTIDAQGNLWMALYQGGLIAKKSKKPTRIICLNPTTMQILDEILLPVTHVTSCVIGGENLDMLYITTARDPISQAATTNEPMAGYLLEVPIHSVGIEQFVVPVMQRNSIKIV
ncbi:Sugar lactone lactonase YvrE [Psychrobacillus psychrotolerans]|uniref:Sugar lactone lactonase YvrE n=1 Tax=Psychrobacillus psychrotolerans TaxID=126156 RepID=A0A1I6B5W1_9BACI|nr:SMP-30/gluconolactonase/LRE family protein [Psychrobacillus psychrotolerans]SFQ76318.1 Sugar lactone lactonase YvrE [Psychrobacillus psychrotolerans]